MSIQVEVWGDFACFSRGEFKAERVSYDVMTPSAARGILESIYWHPGLVWRVDRIYVLAPIQFTNIRRNEVKSVVSARNARTVMTGGSAPLYINTKDDIQQRASLLLRDVRYVIEAHFDMTPQANPGDNPGKFQDIIKRRLERGECYSQPYFGCREFAAHFCRCTASPQQLKQPGFTKDLGYMLYDFDYSDPQNLQPTYFRAQLIDGVLDLTDCEVLR